MELNNRHPLESITNSKSLSMLESLIPFVDYPLKLPLALFIKFSEIKLIINAFRSSENLSRLGLHNNSNSSTDILCALTGMSPEMLKMLFSLSENLGDSFTPDILSGLSGNNSMDLNNIMGMFNQSSSPPENPPEHHKPPEHAHSSELQHSSDPSSFSHDDNGDDFNLHIQNILSEYDMMEAARYDTEQYTDFNESTDDSYYNNKGDE